MKRVRIFNPNISVPGPAFRINDAIGPHDACLFKLGLHDNNAITRNHAEGRRSVPEAFIAEAELVPIIIGGGYDIVYDEVWRNAPTPTRSQNIIGHGLPSPPAISLLVTVGVAKQAPTLRSNDRMCENSV